MKRRIALLNANVLLYREAKWKTRLAIGAMPRQPILSAKHLINLIDMDGISIQDRQVLTYDRIADRYKLNIYKQNIQNLKKKEDA